MGVNIASPRFPPGTGRRSVANRTMTIVKLILPTPPQSRFRVQPSPGYPWRLASPA